MVEPDRADSVLKPMGLHPRAEWAGYLGLLPFVAALLCAVFGHSPFWWQVSERLALGWGAAILGYVSAVHWGLALSWRPAGAVVQAFFVGNTVWMTVTVGLLVAQAPTRLCNAYLEGDQRQAGYGLFLLGIAGGAVWLGSLRFERKRSKPTCNQHG